MFRLSTRAAEDDPRIESDASNDVPVMMLLGSFVKGEEWGTNGSAPAAPGALDVSIVKREEWGASSLAPAALEEARTVSNQQRTPRAWGHCEATKTIFYLDHQQLLRHGRGDVYKIDVGGEIRLMCKLPSGEVVRVKKVDPGRRDGDVTLRRLNPHRS